MRRFDVYGPLGPETMKYAMVPGTDPLDALFTVRRDGLGGGRVRIAGARLVFRDAADQALCAGARRVTPIAPNGWRIEIR